MELESEASRPKSRKWLEFSVVVLAIYAPFLAGGVLRHPTVDATAESTFYRIVATAGLIGVLLYTVYAADGNLRIIGLRRPKPLVDIPLFILSFVALFAMAWAPYFLGPEIVAAFGKLPNSLETYRHSLTAGPFWLSATSVVLLVTLEEFFTRAYLISRLKDLLGNSTAAVILAALMFGSYHVYQGYLNAVLIAILGLVFGAMYVKTGRLWPILIPHVIFDLLAIFSAR